MLVTPMYNGQGLGNQLACYVTTRCIALDKGYDFGVMYPERFKGMIWGPKAKYNLFKNIDMGHPVVGGVVEVEGQAPKVLPEGIDAYYAEAGDERRGYDTNILNIPDRFMIHGCLQGEEYFKHRKDEIAEWLAVTPKDMPYDLCVINFRGGEYKHVPEFFLPQSYWNLAIENMRRMNSNMRFEVHTDDAITARLFFPDFPIIQNMEDNWRSIRYAYWLILSNSSFAWFPAWLNQNVNKVIAPKYWGRHNKNYWSLEQNKTKGWHYQDSNGHLECL